MSMAHEFQRALPLGVEVKAKPLTVVEPLFPQLSKRGFVTVIVLFVVAIVGLNVFINLQLSQGAFVESSLTAQLKEAQVQVEGLQQQITNNASPAQLAKSARALGMVPMESSAFISLHTGEISGKAKPAQPTQASSARSKKADSRPAGWLLTNDSAVLVSGE